MKGFQRVGLWPASAFDGRYSICWISRPNVHQTWILCPVKDFQHVGLRQASTKKTSHTGVASRSSMKAALRLDLPMGDPMKRGNVGYLLTEYNTHERSNEAWKCRISSHET